MSSGRNSKSLRSDHEKTLLKMMIDYEVDQTDISDYEGVSPQAINNRLKRLNGDKVEDFKKLIQKVAENNSGKDGVS
jgi:DNA-binding Lrp family transcriptional regulator